MITKEELAELHARRQVLHNAWSNYMLVKESVDAWLTKLGEKYGAGLEYDITPEGRVVPKEPK